MYILFLCHCSMLHSLPSVDFTSKELNKESPNTGDWTHYYRQQEVWQHLHAFKNPDMAGLTYTLLYFLQQVCKVNTHGSRLVNTSSIPYVWSPEISNKFHGIDNEHATDCQMNLSVGLCLSNMTFLPYLKLKMNSGFLKKKSWVYKN